MKKNTLNRIAFAAALLGSAAILVTPPSGKAQDANLDERVAGIEQRLEALMRANRPAAKRISGGGGTINPLFRGELETTQPEPPARRPRGGGGGGGGAIKGKSVDAANDETGQRLAAVSQRVERLIGLARTRQARRPLPMR